MSEPPIGERLRELHRLCSDCYADYCEFDHDEWPCDIIMALDSLEAENVRLHEQAEALAEVARQARVVLNEWVTEDGGCDHAVGICNCSIYNLIGDIDTALRAYKEARDE